jgi:hypothetical protein
MTKACPETIFTLSAGSTGTAWLSDFLAVNLNRAALHEPLGIDYFSNRMPDIKIMSSFNETGYNAILKDFWKRKFSMLTSNMQIETNHTLGKCGLIENISRTPMVEKSKIIIFKRDIFRQCASYVVRHGFVSITTAWQWYHHHSYQKKLSIRNYFHDLRGLGSLFGIITKWRHAELIVSFISVQKLSLLTCNWSILPPRRVLRSFGKPLDSRGNALCLCAKMKIGCKRLKN